MTIYRYHSVANHLEKFNMRQETLRTDQAGDLGMPVILASFDSQLIEAARAVQMAYLPA
jgi:hypothetical protein